MTYEHIEFEQYIQSKEFFDYSPSKPLPEISQTLEPDVQRPTPSTSDYLVTFSTRSQSYCVGYVDIVNSTKISASLSSEKMSQYYEIFLNSMSKIIEKFGGKVIKNIGDCLLYYFPSVNSSEDGITNCLDSGVAMMGAQSVISEELALKKLPKLRYRISSDFGTVILMNTSLSNSVDLIGPPVNMCSKINRYAGDDEFVIGHDLHQISKKVCGYKFEEIQSCDVGFRYSYPVYKVIAN
ncbi:MAG TPA: adenylate/guanylate cyclase domain-containing protein [Nitrosopumilaceae archaeon]|nr:adenylate/guanylate cyclase domain-containing protein [Nitrosopumilaceae archaeon]